MDQSILIDLFATEIKNRTDRAIALLASVEQPATVAAIQTAGLSLGVRDIKKWNLSQVLFRADQFAVRVAKGWQLTTAGQTRARELGVGGPPPLLDATARSLREVVTTIPDEQRRHFLEDTLLCLDRKAHRPAVVYSWVGAMWILQQTIVGFHLADFNKAANRRFTSNAVPIRNLNSFGRLQDSDCLQLLEDIAVIGKSEHKQLKARLDLRNDAGHPNSVVIDDHTAAAHVHYLIENVYRRF